MRKLKDILITTIALTVICVVATAALAFTNDLTEERIANVDKKAEQQAMTRIISANKYEPGTVNISDVVYYIACDESGTPLGAIFTTSANGYGGAVKVMTGIDTKGNIVAIEVLDASNETPGLGQNATRKTFWEQFKGKSGQISAVKSNPLDNQISTITGATITSNAVTSAVNKALEAHSQIFGQEEGNGNV